VSLEYRCFRYFHFANLCRPGTPSRLAGSAEEAAQAAAKLMYAGHFAVGLVLKTQEPRLPTWAALTGTGLLDILFGIFVPLGIERATVVPHSSPGFRLDYIDWSHSLAMSLVWALVYGALFLGKGKRVAAFAAAAVFSHFVLDVFMHPPDLALWPGSRLHLGLDFWHRFPTGWWWMELGFVAVCCGHYFIKSRSSELYGRHAGWACVVVFLLHVLNSPWLQR